MTGENFARSLLTLINIQCEAFKLLREIPVNSQAWDICKLWMLNLEVSLVFFDTYFCCIVSIYMARICSTSSFETSIHSISSFVLLMLAAVPACIRFSEQIVICLFRQIQTLSQMKSLFFDSSRYLQVMNSAEGIYKMVIYFVDGVLIAYLWTLLAILLHHMFLVWKRKDAAEKGRSTHASKWEMASSMTFHFFLIALNFAVKYTLIDILGILEADSNLAVIRSWTAVVHVVSWLPPRDSIGLLMCLAYIHCRSVYFASLEQARSPRVVIVSSKDSLQVPSKLMDSSKDAISSIPSRPPALNRDLEARDFLNLSLQSTLGSKDYVRPPSAMQRRSAFHPESFAAFEDDPGTESQMEAMFGRMEEMPRFDSCHLDDFF